MARVGALVACEARAWIGTPFVWGQSQKGRGCDCKGLVAGVARELGLPEADSVYGLWTTHRPDRPVPAALLKEGLGALFDRVAASSSADLEDGDVLLLERAGTPFHLAIVSAGGERAIHAQLSPNDRVKETRLAALLKIYRLNSAWRWREGKEATPDA